MALAKLTSSVCREMGMRFLPTRGAYCMGKVRLQDQLMHADMRFSLHKAPCLHGGARSETVLQSKGGLPPDDCCEEEDACLADMQRVIEQYHDNSRCSGLPASIPATASSCIRFKNCRRSFR